MEHLREGTGYFSRLQQSFRTATRTEQPSRGAQKPHQTPEQIPTLLMVFASRKHPYDTPKGTRKMEAQLGAQAALQTGAAAAGRTPSGWSILPSTLQRQTLICRSL